MSGDHLDAISGRRRTWPYGTRYTGETVHVDRSFVIVAVQIEDRREAFVLTGVDVRGVDLGQAQEIILRQGGPLGGYWDIFREA